MSFKGNFNEIDLKEMWNKKEFYEGLTRVFKNIRNKVK